MNITTLSGYLALSLLTLNVWAGPPVVDGLVYLEGGGSFCSASLFAPESYNKDHKALVLTNGHCTGKGSADLFGASYPNTTEMINNITADNIDIYIFKKGAEDVMGTSAYVNGDRDSLLLLATMHKKDIAIYQLNHTYAELETAGFRPLILGKSMPRLGSQLTYHSSAWGSQVACNVAAYADTVIEGIWVWKDMIRMAGEDCRAQGGASGSPVLDSDGRLVAVLNTMYERGEKCTIMNPCERERDSGDTTVMIGAVYSVPVVDLNACFDQNKKIDLKKCGLAR